MAITLAQQLAQWLQPSRSPTSAGDPYAVDANRMGAGRAPFTLGGIGTAVGNALTATSGVGGLIKGGAASVLNNAGAPTSGLGGFILNHLLGGGFNDIPGQTPYDADLKKAVTDKRMRLAEADKIQAVRNQQHRSNNGGVNNFGGTLQPGGGSIRGGYGSRGSGGGRTVGGRAVGNDGRIAGGV